MTWPWTPKPIGMAEQPIPCPTCKGDRPKIRMIALWNYVRRNGVIVGLPDGERLSCQECGAEYSLDFRHGTFQHVSQRPQANTASTPHVTERPQPPALRNRPS